ncbi:MAG: hypothetical protein KGN36_06225 [Acidobacteriota bacterium]|nr:hypothetical protein [Acidobacteriota bacterium]
MYLKWIACAATVLAAGAQVPDQVRQATMRGQGGSSGKCTIEVRVDIAAEVDILGDSGRLRTLAGQPSTWTRMECTAPLPSSMSDFRFRGIDGRGSVKLLQDPRNNNGMAVVRIDDPQAGSEGYTFDIEWSGASGGSATNGFGAAPGGMVAAQPAANGIAGVFSQGRRAVRTISAERAMDLCRAELHTRGQRDYSLSAIDVTAIGVDTSPGRGNWMTGTFNSGGGFMRVASAYRFNCEIDPASGQVRTVEFLRADGSMLQSASGAMQGSYDQNQVFRACQDAVVARAQRDGYQNVAFASTAIDTTRGGRVAGAITATRGPLTDTFDYGCTMDFGSARVTGLDFNRR